MFGHHTRWEPSWRTSATQWILSGLFHGPLRPNGAFAGNNTARVLEFLRDHDGAFRAFVAALESARPAYPLEPLQRLGLALLLHSPRHRSTPGHAIAAVGALVFLKE